MVVAGATLLVELFDITYELYPVFLVFGDCDDVVGLILLGDINEEPPALKVVVGESKPGRFKFKYS